MRTRMLVGALAAALALPAAAHAGGPGVWTKIAPTESGFDQAGLLRTPDGNLHVVTRVREADKTLTYNAYTISKTGKLVAGPMPVISHWETLENDPRLVPDGTGLRLLCICGQDTDHNNFNSVGGVYTATSPDGNTWTLVHGTLSQHTVLNLGLAATTDANGTPIAAFGLNSTLYFHAGIDPNAPAQSPDGSYDSGETSGLLAPALARDTATGNIVMAWYQKFGTKEAYWADQILPSMGTPIMAPASKGGGPNNEPVQQVALASHAGGGVYMAYCSRTSSKACSPIELWKVGAPSAMAVPGSSTGGAIRVALDPQPDGRMWVSWFDSQKNLFHAVRTDPGATHFGALRTIKMIPGVQLAQFGSLQGEGSSGRFDLLANVLPNDGTPNAFWHTQVLAGLTLTASPPKLSSKGGKTVTFTVHDAGDAVKGAKVSCLGRSGTTNAAGKVKLTFAGGVKKGGHVCTATKAAYAPGHTSLRVS